MSEDEQRPKPSLAKLLKYGIDPNALTFEDVGSRRTLLCASIAESLQIDDYSKVDLLLEHRADPSRTSETGDYPLQLAIKGHNFNLSRQLLRAKADVNQQDEKLVTPLHLAAYNDEPRIVQLLLMHKANVNSLDRIGQSPVFFACSRQVLATLSDAQADLLHLNNKGQSALHLASYCGRYEVVASFVENDMLSSMINLPDINGRTPLHHAAIKGHQDVVSRLMDVGADPRLKTNKGDTAMTLADAKEHLDVAYYIYTRMTGGNKSTWREAMQNPVFLTTAAIMGAACFVNRTLLWEFFWDIVDIMLH